MNQEGSHVILEANEPRQHRISIPDYSPLRIGTILRAVANAKGVEKEAILRRS